jgi:hypothetical protein
MVIVFACNLLLAFAPAAQTEEIAADQRANLPTEQ